MNALAYRFVRGGGRTLCALLGHVGLRQPARQLFSAGRRLVASRQAYAWIRVKQGFAEGIWMHLNLPTEGYWQGAHEPDVQVLLPLLLRPGSVFYDIGAHLGFYSLPAARLVGHAGAVIAFDPDPENAARIRSNAQHNGLGEVLSVVQAAVWSQSTAQITYRRGLPRSQGGVSFGGREPVLASDERISVDCVSLDAFAARGNRIPDLVKVDVEGGEPEVVRGGGQLFSSCRPALICEIHRVSEAAWFHKWLHANSYRGFWSAPEQGYPRRLVALPAERLEQGQVLAQNLSAVCPATS